MDFICCLICLIFLKSPWWPVWKLFWSDALDFSNEITKKIKIRKERKKIFCGPS